MASSAEEGRGTLRKATMSRVQARESLMSEWGNPSEQTSDTRKREGTG